MAVKRLFQGLTGRSANDGSQIDYGSVAVISPHDSARRLELLDDFESGGFAWMWATDADGRLIYVSASAAARLDKPLTELLAQPFVTLFETDTENPDERGAGRPLKFQLSARNKLVDVTVRFAPTRLSSVDGTGAGRPAWWSISGHPKFDRGGKFLGYRGSAKDITTEYERKLEDSRLAEYDSLTGLANRHRMTRRLESTLAAYKAAKRSCTLMMHDLDKFKQVNDMMGHPAGRGVAPGRPAPAARDRRSRRDRAPGRRRVPGDPPRPRRSWQIG